MNSVKVIVPEKIGLISPEIYGQFAEHIGGVFYGGLWVGKDSKIPNERGFRKDALDALRKISVPVLRWPGGCFAETYNWRDGIGKDRPVRHNWWTRNDGRLESNEVGTHEFFDLCELLGAKAYLAINVTSITPLEAREWLDYCLSAKGSTTLAKLREENGHPEPFKIDYIGVGNENWGGGGNMSADYYALEYRRFATVIDNVVAACHSDAKLVAGGANSHDYRWTHDLCENISQNTRIPGWGMSLHYYCGTAGTATEFSGEEFEKVVNRASDMEKLINRHSAIAEGFGLEEKTRLVIDEWGCWHKDGSGPSRGYNLFEQQSTMRDAIVSALTLNIFNNYSHKVYMANVAQVCNNLHCLLLCDGKDNLITTPTYHVFDMFASHMGAHTVRVLTDNPDVVSVSASVKDGNMTITLANKSYSEDCDISLDIFSKDEAYTPIEAKILRADAPTEHNTFESPNKIVPKDIEIDLSSPIRLSHASVISIKLKANSAL